MTDFQVSALQLILLIGLAGLVWFLSRLPKPKNPRLENWRSVGAIVLAATLLIWTESGKNGFHLRYLGYAALAIVGYCGLVYVWNLAEPKS